MKIIRFLLAVGWILGGTGCGDNTPPVQPIDPERVEAIRQVQHDRSIISRFQIVVRGRFNVNEYMQYHFEDELKKINRLPKNERGAARSKIINKAKEEIKRHEVEFASLSESYRNMRSSSSLANLQRVATANFDLGIRITAASLSRQENSLRERRMRLERDKEKMDAEKRETEEAALKK
ncbi:MAG: hypothetical protein WC198_05655, partial [Victivallaceae bacterium]